jgi:deoxyribodipyrimidine photo-lyase
MWLRRDLRLSDNAALYHALRGGLPVQIIFIFDTDILNQLENKYDRRLIFIHRALQTVNNHLKQHGATLHTYYGKPVDVWKNVLKDYKVEKVFANHDYEPYAHQRDNEVRNLLQSHSILFETYKDQVIFEKDEVCKPDGLPYTVFTPYKNKYLSQLNANHLKSYYNEKHFSAFLKQEEKQIIPLSEMGFIEDNILFPKSNVENTVLKQYETTRDFPAMNATSRLSVHLRFGTVSIRQLMRQAMINSAVWTNELIWREFYMMILYKFPHVATDAFKPRYNAIPWRNNEQEFEKWCTGNTGYPIVDAGMRELLATGFMHNRVRMIVASFLVKHLLIDWKWGEAWFAKHLIDFELSSNNGGWQWAASSGCDAAPYFRIFNPYEQTKRFDSNFEYVKKWVPEFQELTYPQPIVEHTFARNRCLATYKQALQEN